MWQHFVQLMELISKKKSYIPKLTLLLIHFNRFLVTVNEYENISQKKLRDQIVIQKNHPTNQTQRKANDARNQMHDQKTLRI